MIEVIFFLLIAGFFACMWFLVCNSRTYKHRMQLIDWIYDGTGNWRKRSACFESVSYDQHLWYIFTFRDPKKLYDFSNCP